MKRLIVFLPAAIMTLLVGCADDSFVHDVTDGRQVTDNKVDYTGDVHSTQVNFENARIASCDDGVAIIKLDVVITYKGTGEIGYLLGDPLMPDRFDAKVFKVDKEKTLKLSDVEVDTDGEDTDLVVIAVGAESSQIGYDSLPTIPSTQCGMEGI